jgi:hypothetical protein
VAHPARSVTHGSPHGRRRAEEVFASISVYPVADLAMRPIHAMYFERRMQRYRVLQLEPRDVLMRESPAIFERVFATNAD